LIFEIDEALPEQIEVDPYRLKQVIINLISNSLKYTLEGHVKIRVTSINITDIII
jgi:signal transduction histidine kinase